MTAIYVIEVMKSIIVFLLAGLGHICVHISYVSVLLPSEPFSQNMSLHTKVFNLNSQAGSSWTSRTTSTETKNADTGICKVLICNM